jgi:hypothetical protein
LRRTGNGRATGEIPAIGVQGGPPTDPRGGNTMSIVAILIIVILILLAIYLFQRVR